jgi:glycosyltransferase involved in cell wall biosynthesis
MKLSVLLITYNQEHYIEQCLEGIKIQQCNFDFNIVVADDASTDNTLAKIKSFCEETKQQSLFLDSTTNLGYIKNYQRAFAACEGDYIAIIEGDDYWTDPYRLQKHVDFLDNHRESSCSFNRIVFFNEDKSDYYIRTWDNAETYKYYTAAQIASYNYIGNLSACVFRKSLIASLPEKVYKMDMFTDWFLGVYMGQYGLVAELKDTMSVYRMHGGGVWSGQNEKKKLEQIRQNIPDYNEFFGLKFNSEYLRYDTYLLSIIENQKSKKKKDYIPPFLFSLMKWIVPPVFYKK